MTFGLSIHQLSSFPSLAILNNAVMSEFLCGPMCSFVLGTYLGVKFLGYMAILCSTFLGAAKLITKIQTYFLFLQKYMRESRFLHILTNTLSFLSLFFHIRWHIGSYFPDQGSNPCSLQWKHNILTTGQPGKALSPISLIVIMPVDDMVAYYSFDLCFPND